jgi:hypothetical protein
MHELSLSHGQPAAELLLRHQFERGTRVRSGADGVGVSSIRFGCERLRSGEDQQHYCDRGCD